MEAIPAILEPRCIMTIKIELEPEGRAGAPRNGHVPWDATSPNTSIRS